MSEINNIKEKRHLTNRFFYFFSLAAKITSELFIVWPNWKKMAN